MRFIYILKCNDTTFYTGITNNLEKRLYDHNNTKVGARYTKSRRPVILIWNKKVKDKLTAMKLEYKIKRLSREKKEELIKTKKI